MKPGVEGPEALKRFNHGVPATLLGAPKEPVEILTPKCKRVRVLNRVLHGISHLGPLRTIVAPGHQRRVFLWRP
jgi:hypothetical protein